MKTLTVGEFKANFSEVVEQLKTGEKFAVTYGKKKQIVGYFVPQDPAPQKKIKLGIAAGRGRVIFGPDFKMTEEEFLGL